MAEEKPVDQLNPAEAMAYLRTRSLYIATPAYGGFMTVNYVNALMEFRDLLRDCGIKHTVSFKYNESLISRARNAMVADFRRNTDYTDFLFIDADIGFNPKDLVSLLFYQDKRVIGAPCVRKSFAWQRIQQAIKQSDKLFTEEEIMQMAGEFVINFPPDEQPAQMMLSEITEVQDIGTGIMLVRRGVFDELEQQHPELMYLPMGGEGQRFPYMNFFQNGIDPDSARFNPGNIPDYIPEDYGFCRLCRRSGIKIWIAPWMETSHMGSYMFKGSMPAVARVGGALR